ncbi:MAG: universal stress protein [Chloroflexi bacterium]|nr:universal stress protein [Chloroflexota bacterium]
MIQNILVPLDGSKHSEAALPYAIAIAQGAGAGVTLTRVADEPFLEIDPFGPPPYSLDEVRAVKETIEEDVRNYLEEQAQRLRDLGPQVETAVLSGRPSEAILDFAEERQPSLIAMSTRGRSGLSRIVLGSVANRVLQGTRLPVMLISPRDDDQPTEAVARLQQIVVPLDTSGMGEAALPLARELARTLGLDMALVMAIPTASELYLGTQLVAHPTNFLETLEQAARQYLRELAQRIATEDGLDAGVYILRGEPGNAIVEYARARSNILIAMSTHGRSGIGRWLLGSVTDKVVRSSGDPVLVVRPAAPEQ